MYYKHTQVSYLFVFIMIILTLIIGISFVSTTFSVEVIPIIIIILCIVGSFASLTVTVDDKDLKLKFGYGIFSKKFKLEKIASVKAVRHHWYHGWGIKYWTPRKMWVYNVSGFDMVEVEMKTGKIFRVGTDELDRLEDAIRQKLKK